MNAHNHNLVLEKEKVEKIVKDQETRRTLTRECHFWFFHIYFAHYIKYKMADFHRELFAITEDREAKRVVIEAFRGSGKTTIMGMSYAIWSILGSPKKKYIVMLAQTESQAKMYLANIKIELESNGLLMSDLGPFEEPNDEWRATSIVIPRYDARITVASIDKSIRGQKHRQYRPDLIITDDLENLDTVRTQESRDKIYNWLMGDIIPMGDKNTQLVVIGTKLHEDSLIARLKREIHNDSTRGISKAFPFLTDDKKAQWAEKFQTEAEIEEVRKSVSYQSWEREYMLNIIPSDDQVVKKEWLHYYDSLPLTDASSNFRYAITGVDPAISEAESADYTAMVSGMVYGRKDNMKIYVMRNPINERMDFPKTVQKTKDVSKILGNGIPTEIAIEAVAYQKSIVQQLQSEGYPAKEYSPQGKDKRARLALVSNLIQTGKVIFPKTGAEKLINQMLNFGSEKHDDLVDAFTVMILSIIEKENYTRQGYYPFLNEQLLKLSFVESLPAVEEKRLGIILAGGSRNFSSIVLRSGNLIRVLYHEATDNVEVLLKKIVAIAREEKILVSRRYMFIDNAVAGGREFCEHLKEHMSKIDIERGSTYDLCFGINLSRQLTGGKYADIRTEACYNFQQWLKDDGRLLRHPCLDDLASITYCEYMGSKVKIIEKEKLLEDGLDSSILDAIALTFVTGLESDRVQFKQKPWQTISIYEGN